MLVATLGAGWAIGVDAASFGVSALLLYHLQIQEQGQRQTDSVAADLVAGGRAFVSRHWLVSLVAQFSLFHLVVWAPLFVLGPLITEQRLGGAATWAAVMTVYGIGAILGGGLGIRLQPKRPLVIVSLLFIPQVLSLLALATSSGSVVLSAALLLAGIANGYMTTLWDTALHVLVPSALLSRVSSYDWFASMIFLPLGCYALVGPVSAVLGPETTLWLAAGVQVLASLLSVTLISRRAIWGATF